MSLFLEMLSGENKGKKYPLSSGRFIIGRGENAQIQILSHQLSREHAEIIVEKNAVRILDRGSANGTSVNGRFITSATLKNGDSIVLGDVTLGFSGPVIPKSGAERLNQTTERSPGIYAATKVVTDRLRPRALWPLFTMVLSATLVFSSLVSGFAFRSMMKDRLYRMSMSRAYDLVRLLSERNKEDLKYNNQLLLDVDSIRKEKGVKEAYILGDKGKILAPIVKLNQIDQDPSILEALVANQESRILPIPGPEQGTFIYVHPIRAYNDKTGQYEVLGVAKIVFSPQDAIGSFPEANQLMMLMVVFSLGLSIILGWLFTRLLSQPMFRLAERIHQWRTGQVFQKENPPYQEWGPLYDAVDRALEEAENS